jgi:hypothetical protein
MYFFLSTLFNLLYTFTAHNFANRIHLYDISDLELQPELDPPVLTLSPVTLCIRWYDWQKSSDLYQIMMIRTVDGNWCYMN